MCSTLHLDNVATASSVGSGDFTCLTVNQDGDCFVVGTGNGFAIYNTWPCKLVKYHKESVGRLYHIEMIQRTNILALVGSKGGQNTVMLWDDAAKKFTGELKFKSQVVGVQMLRQRIVVVLETKIYVYNLQDLK